MENEVLSEKMFCEIRVKGRLDPYWAEWFDPMRIETEAETTIISGLIADQPALQGLMGKISTLGLTVISIKFGESEE